MSVRISWRVYSTEGAVAPVVTLSDPTGAWGVRRVDTGETVVAAGTAMTVDNDEYSHLFDEPELETGREYEYYLKVVEAGNTYYINGRATGIMDWYETDTLGGVRRILVDISGRVDLVRDAANGDYTDLGKANFYLNQAQNWLDRRLANAKGAAKLYKTLAANASMVSFTRARYVKRVWHILDELGTRQLVGWSTLNAGLAPDQASETAVTLPDAAPTTLFGNHWAYKAIYITPEDQNRDLLIEAEWYCPKLVNDGDRSFWTVEEPLLLVHAAMMLMEVGMRNTQGVNDFAGPIQDDLVKIYHDVVAEESAGPPCRWRMRLT